MDAADTLAIYDSLERPDSCARSKSRADGRTGFAALILSAADDFGADSRVSDDAADLRSWHTCHGSKGQRHRE